MKQKVITKVLKVSDNTKEKMIKYFEYKKRDKTPPYAIFQADEADTVITLYNSGKVVFQGISADIDANIWNEMEKKLNGKDGLVEKKEKKDKVKDTSNILPININSIGSDEVGTGDYFGPIVVTSTYVNVENINFLHSLKVKDSKKMTDEEILEIVPQIIKKIPYSASILSNVEYNKYHEDGFNMNQIKAILHNKVLFNMKEKYNDYDYIVVDQFEIPSAYFKHISKSLNQVKNITFLTKAEDKCLSVACASLISRYIFLKEMDKLSDSIGILLPKGANEEVDNTAVNIVKKYGIDKLTSIAKLNFKNTSKIEEILKK